MHAAPSLSVGTMVVGSAKKWKEKYDGIKCKVVDHLSQHVKVEIMEGPATGEFHKYTYDRVKPLAQAYTPSSEASAPAEPASAGSASASTAAPLPPPSEAPPDVEVNTQDVAIMDVSALWKTF